MSESAHPSPCPVGLRAARSNAAKRWTTKVDLADRLEQTRIRLVESLEQDLAVDDLAQAANLSRAHFVTSFRKQFGTSPMAYRSEARYSAAHRMVCETGLPLHEIRTRVGITAPSSFARDFKRRYGVSPTQLRNLGTPVSD